jgi:hypothetical protein
MNGTREIKSAIQWLAAMVFIGILVHELSSIPRVNP